MPPPPVTAVLSSSSQPPSPPSNCMCTSTFIRLLAIALTLILFLKCIHMQIDLAWEDTRIQEPFLSFGVALGGTW